MIGCGIVPQPGANYLEIADEFYKRVEAIQKDIPKDYKLDFALDNTSFIRKSVEEVEENPGDCHYPGNYHHLPLLP